MQQEIDKVFFYTRYIDSFVFRTLIAGYELLQCVVFGEIELKM